MPSTDHEPSGAQEGIEGAVTDEDLAIRLHTSQFTDKSVSAAVWRAATVDYRDRWRALAMVAVDALKEPLERSGYERARKEIVEALRQADTTGWPGGRASDVAGCQEAAAKIAESVGPSDG